MPVTMIDVGTSSVSHVDNSYREEIVAKVNEVVISEPVPEPVPTDEEGEDTGRTSNVEEEKAVEINAEVSGMMTDTRVETPDSAMVQMNSVENAGGSRTVDDLSWMKDFWWLEDSMEASRHPLSCILCGVKLVRHHRQVLLHGEGSGHKNKFFQCNKFSMLKKFVLSSKKDLAEELNMNVGAVHILTENSQVKDELFEKIKRATSFCVSFYSHEGRVRELTIIGGVICLCFHQRLFSVARRPKITALLRYIFESCEVEKVGKDLWFLMVLLFKTFEIKSKNCYTIHKVDLLERPLGVEVKNSMVTLMSNARATLQVMPWTAAYNESEGPLMITDSNLPIVKSLVRYSLEIDDERESFNNEHWRCRFYSVSIVDGGKQLVLKPVPSKYKLRKGSTARIHTTCTDHAGEMRGWQRGTLKKMDVLGEPLPEGKPVQVVDVERYNEMNVSLLESKIYAVSYLSMNRKTINPFQHKIDMPKYAKKHHEYFSLN